MAINEAPAVDEVERSKRTRRALPTLRNASALYLLLVEFVVFALWIPDLFYSTATFRVVLSGQVVMVMVALALLVPFTAGAFDLSAGAMVAFSLVIVSILQQHEVVGMGLSILIALAACALVGMISGLIVVRLKVNSFIATLGMGQIIGALTLYISENQQIVGVFGDGFLSVARGNWLGVPRPFFYLAALGLLLWYVLNWTPLGRDLFATGANPEAARLAGVPTDRLVIGSLVASAVIAGGAGILLGAQVGSFSNSFGAPLLFPAFAALFFGLSQFGGRSTAWGTIVAAYVLAFGVQGLNLGAGFGSYWINPLFNGLALVVAVGFVSHESRSAKAKATAPAAES